MRREQRARSILHTSTTNRDCQQMGLICGRQDLSVPELEHSVHTQYSTFLHTNIRTLFVGESLWRRELIGKHYLAHIFRHLTYVGVGHCLSLTPMEKQKTVSRFLYFFFFPLCVSWPLSQLLSSKWEEDEEREFFFGHPFPAVWIILC